MAKAKRNVNVTVQYLAQSDAEFKQDFERRCPKYAHFQRIILQLAIGKAYADSLEEPLPSEVVRYLEIVMAELHAEWAACCSIRKECVCHYAQAELFPEIRHRTGDSEREYQEIVFKRFCRVLEEIKPVEVATFAIFPAELGACAPDPAAPFLVRNLLLGQQRRLLVAPAQQAAEVGEAHF